MKSRVINSKHMIEHKNGYTGYTSRLKPSLFYGVPAEEGIIWLQDSHTNKMAKFILDEVIGQEKGMIWVYKPTQKFIDKFPHLENKTIKIHFDLWQTHPFAIKKRAGLVKKKGWKKREYEKIAREKVKMFKKFFSILGYPMEETSQVFIIIFPDNTKHTFERAVIKKSEISIPEFVEFHLYMEKFGIYS